MRTLLIVNADDLGYDPAIDRGIFLAHAEGLVTAATVMVDTPFAERALGEAPESLDLGLHVVLAGDPPSGTRSAIDRQIARFTELRGAPPTHLDSHRHVHATPGALRAFAEAARDAGIPLRALDAPMRETLRGLGVATTDAFLGDGALRPCWTKERLRSALGELPEGVVELMCHPGLAPTHARTSFAAAREVELAALCDPGMVPLLQVAEVALGRFPELMARFGPQAPKRAATKCPERGS